MGKFTDLTTDTSNRSAPNLNKATPNYVSLKRGLNEASLLVDDIILKNYLSKLTDMEVIPLPNDMKQISDIRLFKITEMVYQNDEYSTYKFASVFNAVQNLNCGIFIIVNSNGKETNFYMGVRAIGDRYTTNSLKNTLKNSLCGQFPGVKTDNLLDTAAKDFFDCIPSKNIAAVSCVAKNKDAEFKDNDRFIQGLEKLALAMQGQCYTAVVLAKGASTEQLVDTRSAYEMIYTQLSPFANMQLSYGTNTALSISDAFSKGSSFGSSHSTNKSEQIGSSHSTGKATNTSETKTDTKQMLLKGAGTALLGIASIVTAPLTGGASLAAAGIVMAGQAGLNSIAPKQNMKGTSTNENHTENRSESAGESDSTNESANENHTNTRGLTSGTSENIQLTMQNKTLINTLERIDEQLKRLDECESLGMWECAAYFLSDSQETAEMAAGTYKALMKGEKSGVETSAINIWTYRDKAKLPLLREYITNFIHPIFKYSCNSATLPLTAATLISSNELAIQMGLPRKSVCGFPVIEHADFGREVVKYNKCDSKKSITLGKIFAMGSEHDTDVPIDCDSLTMHTFITGSTGSGKSNTIYEILNKLRTVYKIPFLVVEPAKGEYKNIFGQFEDVSVYGTNPKKTKLLRINPFRFSSDIHVLEHLDRLVELFNVCWPMYAAMPAILKEAMEKSYEVAGWDISVSENKKGEVFPNFVDLLEQIESTIMNSKYSADSKGDYSGALCTRVRSLTNGLNGMIFTSDDLTDAELFDKNVIVDLSRVGSTETKSLIMGLLVVKLNEYRMTSVKTNSPLKHITVLEEAHNLLKRTTVEQSSESSDLLGKSVELLSNSIAEMRTYGEGFIIADQSPGLLDMSVIRNTNTKIILRLPEQSDRELVGFAASLDEEQIAELSKLEQGVAAVYQNDWVEPVLVKISKCKIKETEYSFGGHVMVSSRILREQIICLLVQGRIVERLDFDITRIERKLKALNLSSRNHEFVEKLIAEYKSKGKLTLWNDSEFTKLSRCLTGLLGVHTQVENAVSNSVDNGELTGKLSTIVQQFVPCASEEFVLTLSQCFMKDFCVGKEETEVRKRIYMQWIDSTREGGVRL